MSRTYELQRQAVVAQLANHLRDRHGYDHVTMATTAAGMDRAAVFANLVSVARGESDVTRPVEPLERGAGLFTETGATHVVITREDVRTAAHLVNDTEVEGRFRLLQTFEDKFRPTIERVFRGRALPDDNASVLTTKDGMRVWRFDHEGETFVARQFPTDQTAHVEFYRSELASGERLPDTAEHLAGISFELNCTVSTFIDGQSLNAFTASEFARTFDRKQINEFFQLMLQIDEGGMQVDKSAPGNFPYLPSRGIGVIDYQDRIGPSKRAENRPQNDARAVQDAFDVLRMPICETTADRPAQISLFYNIRDAMQSDPRIGKIVDEIATTEIGKSAKLHRQAIYDKRRREPVTPDPTAQRSTGKSTFAETPAQEI